MSRPPLKSMMDNGSSIVKPYYTNIDYGGKGEDTPLYM